MLPKEKPPDPKPPDGKIKATHSKSEEIMPSQLDVNNDHSKCCYLRNFSGPFFVCVENAERDGSPLYDINVCKMLRNNNVREAIKVDTVNKHRVMIEFSGPEAANSFLKHSLIEVNKLKAYIPKQYVQKIGVIRHVAQNISEEEIINNLNTDCKIVSVCRLNKRVRNSDGRVEYSPTQSVRVTFHSQKLPANVYLYLAARKVVPYIFRVTQCYQCLRYGHTAKICKSQIRCSKCGNTGHDDTSCVLTEKCVHCQLDHKATDRKCPEFLRQTVLKKAMSVQAITFKEANSKYPPLKNSFSPLDMITDFPELPKISSEQECNPINEYNSYKSKLMSRYKKVNKKRKYVSPGDSPSKVNSNASTPLVEKVDPKMGISLFNPHKTSSEQKFISEITALLYKLNSNQYSERESLDLIGATLYNLVRSNEKLTEELKEKYKPPE